MEFEGFNLLILSMGLKVNMLMGIEADVIPQQESL